MGIEQESDSSEDSETDEEEDLDDQFMFLDLYMFDACKAEQSTEVALAYPSQPSPNAKIYILPGKYDKPIPAIAYFDTGAAYSFIKPNILPSTRWDSCSVLSKQPTAKFSTFLS